MYRIALFAAAFLSVAAFVRAQTQFEPVKPPPSPTTQTSPGLPLEPGAAETEIDSDVYVGDMAPDFKLDGTAGQTVRLADLGGSWAVIVFDESRAKLGALKSVEPGLRGLGARLYGVTKDGWETLKGYSERERIPFPLLSDLTGQISQLYGMYDVESDQIMPGLVLLDPKGVVRMIIDGQSLHGPEVLQLARHAITGA